MAIHDDLGKRMKIYEAVSKNVLMRRTPVAIRIDGKAFHTFTRGMLKPFDDILMDSMQETTRMLCAHIQGCVLGYTQSDEITLILCDYQTLETSAWFDYEVEKLCSIAASMATSYFIRAFKRHVECWIEAFHGDIMMSDRCAAYADRMTEKADYGTPMFDARAFNIPREEVTNLVYWRQLDAMRNSVQMVGQANFSHKELQGMSCEKIKEMLIAKEDCPAWENYPIECQRGVCAIKTETGWIIDKNIPIFKGEGREYIEKLITFEEV